MSPEQRRVIRSLIQQNRLEEARTLLLTMDDPVAQQWVEKADGDIPEPPLPRSGGNIFRIFYLLAIIGAFAIGIILGGVWFRSRSTGATSSVTITAAVTEPSVTQTPLPAVIASATQAVPTLTPMPSPTVDTVSTQQISATAIAHTMQTATQIMESQIIAQTQSAIGLTPTPVPLKTCKTADVQAWSKQVSSFIHIPTLIGAIQQNPTDEVAQELRNTVLVDREAVELVLFPECVTVARKALLEAHTEMLAGLDAYVSGFADVSNTHVDKSLDDLQQYADELQYVLDHFAEA